MIGTLLKLFIISLSSPVKTARKFSFEKIKVLVRALKYESSRQILTNFKRYISGGHTGNQFVSEERIDLFTVKEEMLRVRKEQFENFIRSGSKIFFDKESPLLSIVIICFNQVALTYACLCSILKNVSINYEVIIIDNHSTDETSCLLERIEGATIIRNDENLHFLKANNQAIPYVQGKYILFLNNDTEITESAISSAIKTLTWNEKVGAVGGKLVLPDGTLQEAGSIIWRDGSCLGYGRNENPECPEFNFKRVTDYCSGAFLLTPLQLFQEYGGFDPRFEPAYYEDSDYCLWLQEKGFHVVYDPGALVHHFESGSSTSDQARSLQQKNKAMFYEKHYRQLSKHFEYDAANILKARFAASQKDRKKILYIDDRVPHNDLGAGFPRSNRILKVIGELGYDLTIYPLNFPNDDDRDTTYRDIDHFVEIARGYGLDDFKQFIHPRINYFDIIWISRPHNMKSLREMLSGLKGRCKIVYDVEAIVADRVITKKEIHGKIMTEEKKRSAYEKELGLSTPADIIITVSENDAVKFRHRDKSNVFVLGHTLDLIEPVSGFDEREGLLFVGNLDDDASPNVDSMLWFVNDVLPVIRQKIPGMTLDIVGSANSTKIRFLEQEGVSVKGRVVSVADFYNKRRIFIAPTRFAAGIPYKIHEASSFGLPVVATQLLCDQLDWHHRKELMAADIDKMDFANKVLELYNNKMLWETLQKNAMGYIRDKMSYDAYKNTISDILRLSN